MSDRDQEKVECSVCGKVVVGRVPKGGDGTQLNPYPHKDDWWGKPCTGVHSEGLPLCTEGSSNE